jgi:hypothetical protein
VMTQPSRVAKVILVVMALCEGDMASFPAIAASSVGSLELETRSTRHCLRSESIDWQHEPSSQVSSR